MSNLLNISRLRNQSFTVGVSTYTAKLIPTVHRRVMSIGKPPWHRRRNLCCLELHRHQVMSQRSKAARKPRTDIERWRPIAKQIRQRRGIK